MIPDGTDRPPLHTAGEHAVDEAAHLLAFLRDRDVPCPACGYSLRDLTEPRCPECRHAVTLTVGMIEPRIGWLIVTVAPGIFSGIAAGILTLVALYAILVAGAAPPPGLVIVLILFGAVSGGLSIALIIDRATLLRAPQRVQMIWAAIAWIIHVLAFIILVLSI